MVIEKNKTEYRLHRGWVLTNLINEKQDSSIIRTEVNDKFCRILVSEHPGIFIYISSIF